MKKMHSFTLPALLTFSLMSIQFSSKQGASGDPTHANATEDHEYSQNHSHANEDTLPSHTQSVQRFSYLSMNGEFKMNPNDTLTQNDPRNPSKLVMSTSEKAGTITRIAFYEHDSMDKLWADCGYEFIGSMPDPHYYPHQSKTSIWDIFKRVEHFEGDCATFEYVASRSPHGDPIHLHLRYGDDPKALLAMSNDEELENFNPWWSVYCDINRTIRCD